jgi:hypothetical protein
MQCAMYKPFSSVAAPRLYERMLPAREHETQECSLMNLWIWQQDLSHGIQKIFIQIKIKLCMSAKKERVQEKLWMDKT